LDEVKGRQNPSHGDHVTFQPRAVNKIKLIVRTLIFTSQVKIRQTDFGLIVRNLILDISGNPKRFVLFTVFYNARAYYPVLAILFLDLGLTLDQFVLLNLVWAATIFLT
jgi:hypothetical protein